MADRSGRQIVKVYEDTGISGAKGWEKRPGLDAMMKAVNATVEQNSRALKKMKPSHR